MGLQKLVSDGVSRNLEYSVGKECTILGNFFVALLTFVLYSFFLFATSLCQRDGPIPHVTGTSGSDCKPCLRIDLVK